MIILDLNNKTINFVKEVSNAIHDGKIVVLPFDTVYGFACDPRDEKALQKIYELKKRPVNKTIGLAVSNIKMMNSLTKLTSAQKEYIAERIPGKFTFILKNEAGSSISKSCVQNGTVGVRIPDSELILKITEACGGIIAQTSANISGQLNCFSLTDLRQQYSEQFLSRIDLIIDGGKLDNVSPSRLIDLTGKSPKEIERK